MKRFGSIFIQFLFVLSVISIALGVSPRTGMSAELPEGIQEQISYDVTPLTPGPNENVTISVTSYSANLSGADISWSVNGVLSVRGTGATSFSFKMGGLGEQKNISLRIVKANGGIITREFSFTPAGLELVFEADGYTPPFYDGRTVFTHQAPYHVVAIARFTDATGKTYQPSELLYTWKINGRANLPADGYGRSTMNAKGELISRPFYVSATVETPDGSLRANKSIFITPYEAEMQVYEDNPLYGVMYEKALTGTYPLDRSEVSVVAEPYFFGVSDPEDASLTYVWNLAGENLAIPPNQNKLIIRNDNNSVGNTTVSVFARHTGDILQEAGTNFSIDHSTPQQ